MFIRKSTLSDTIYAAGLAVKMWKSHTIEELKQEFDEYIKDGGAVFLAWQGDETVGFAQCGLRYDYVEGTDSSPVGYLEGVLVAESNRRQGVGKMLISACESWAREQGCTEFASDCELTNEDSLSFHLKVGFKEANRIICFTKKL